jgi:serine phosphatase RsbU (regulator of sigma subunit)
MEGHPPDVVLGMCSHQLNVNRDGHLSTVIIGVGDIESGVITLANAGHLNPLRISEDSAEFIPTEVGLPLGVEPGSYSVTTVQLASGTAFVAFTDGLVERRGESLDVGLGRLIQAVTGRTSTVDDLLSLLLGTLGPAGSDDDVAMLAFRWTSPVDTSTPPAATLDRVR